MKRFTAILFILAAAVFSAAAKNVSFRTEDYSGTVVYSEKLKQGDALFARMNMHISRYAKKKNSSDVKAVLQLYRDNQKLDSAQFFFLNSKTRRQTAPDMLAAIPLTRSLEPGSSYSIKIIFSTGIQDENAKELILPFSLESNPVKEVFMEKNSDEAGKIQFMSLERINQAEKISSILETINASSLYSFKAFTLPLKDSVKKSSFGERTVFSTEGQKSRTITLSGNVYAASDGTDVYACAEGKIMLAEYIASSGWTVVIEHLPGLYSVYKNLGTVNVKNGSSIKQGEKLGLTGTSGTNPASLFQWDVWLNNSPVNPDFFTSDFLFSSAE